MAGRSQYDNRDVRVEFSPNSIRNAQGHVVYEDRSRGNSKVASRPMDYVYVNEAYVGSVNNVSQAVVNNRIPEPPTTVIREQYWACSKWSQSQKLLAVAVGVLLGVVISLSVSYALTTPPKDVIGGIFRSDISAIE